MNNKPVLEIIGVIGVVALAAFFRLYSIHQFPSGLSPEEAIGAQNAVAILEGDIRAFYPSDGGQEGLFFYIEALSLKLFGIGVWQLRVASAVVGILTVLALYFATRPFFGKLAALVSAGFLATSYWHITVSRGSFREILVPFFIAAFTAAVGYLVQSVKDKKFTASYVYAAVAGLFFSGGFYSYITFRAMLGVVLGIVVLMLLAAMHPKIGFPHAKRYGKQAGVAVAVGILTLLPLGWYFVQHPQDFIGEAGTTSVFNPELQQQVGGGTLGGTILVSTRETLRGFFITGANNWQHSVVGYAFVNPLVSILFLVGLSWAIRGAWQVFRSIVAGKEVHLGMVYPYILLLLVGMFVPVILTAKDLPHGLRSLGLIIPICMLAGTAGAVTFRWATSIVSGGVRSAVIGCLLALSVLGVLYDGLLYFGVAQFDSEAAYAYRADILDVSNYISEYRAANPEAPSPRVVIDKPAQHSLQFLQNGEYEVIEPDRVLGTSLDMGELIIFTQSSINEANEYEELYDTSIELVESRKNEWGQEVLRVYKLLDMNGVAPKTPEFGLDA